MTDELRDAFGRAAERHGPPPEWFERIERRMGRRRRNRRIAAGTVGIGVSLALFVPLALQIAEPDVRPGGGVGAPRVATDCGLATPPTAVWRWDGSPGDEVADRDATLEGRFAGFTQGIAGEALILDGERDFAAIPDDPALNVGNGDFTIAVWVRFDTLSGEQVLVEDWVDPLSPGSPTGWTFSKLRGGRLRLALWPSGVVETGPLNLRAERWIHVAARRQGDRVSILVDGREVASNRLTDPGRSLDSPSALRFGHRGGPPDTPGSEDGRGFYLDGRLDEAVFVVGSALSDGEIVTLAERPDACAPDLPNIALGMPATASSSGEGTAPSDAVDGSSTTLWNSGQYAPRWIEIDLGRPRSIAQVRLLTSQLPDGETVHRVYGRANEADPFLLLHEFAGFTPDSEWLEHAPPTPWEDIRFLRIESTESPSWIAWREINVYALP